MTDINVQTTTTPIQIVARGPRGLPGPAIELRVDNGVLEWRVVKANPDPWAPLIDLGEFLTDSEAARDLARRWAAEDEDVVVDDGLYSALHYAAKSLASAAMADASAGSAATARSDAEDARDLASGYAADAGGHAGTATAQAGIATGAAEDAAEARDRAEEWAEAGEDVEVEAGQYSARHHALKAAASAAAAATFDPDDYYQKAASDARFAPVDHSHASATTGAAGFMSADDKAKLDGVTAGATANQSDAYLLDRDHHTGTQLAETISDFSTAADARVSDAIGTTVQAYSTALTQIAGLGDPGADRLMFWDASAGAYAYLVASTGLTLSGTNLTVRTASTTQTGIVELATNAEAQAGTDTSRAVTPAALASVTATETRAGLIEIATEAEVLSGTDTSRAVVPATLAAALSGAGGGAYEAIGAPVVITSPALAVDFVLPSGYEDFEVRFSGITCSVGAPNLWLRTSADGGSTFDTTVYHHGGVERNAANTTVTGFNAQTAAFEISGATATVANQKIDGKATIIAPQTSGYTSVLFESVIATPGVNRPISRWGGGSRQVVQTVDAIRLMLSSGAITSGRFQLYGVKTG